MGVALAAVVAVGVAEKEVATHARARCALCSRWPNPQKQAARARVAVVVVVARMVVLELAVARGRRVVRTRAQQLLDHEDRRKTARRMQIGSQAESHRAIRTADREIQFCLGEVLIYIRFFLSFGSLEEHRHMRNRTVVLGALLEPRA